MPITSLPRLQGMQHYYAVLNKTKDIVHFYVELMLGIIKYTIEWEFIDSSDFNTHVHKTRYIHSYK